MATTKPETDITDPGKELDEALAATFPASDPPSATSFTPPACANDDCEMEMQSAYIIISKAMASKDHSQWRMTSNGRWVSGNVPAIYASLSPAAAMLESLAKQDVGCDGDKWMMATLRFPARNLLRLDTPMENWKERPYRAEVRIFGDQWAMEQQSLALRVPSAVCPSEYNVLINTAHPDFREVVVENIAPLQYDTRLTR